MNEIPYTRPETEYPPTRNDIENIQHYISILEEAVHENPQSVGFNPTAEIKDYSELLTQESATLEQDGFDRESRALLELGQLLVDSLNFK